MPNGRDFFFQSGAGGGGSSSGQGGINYITNYGFEENANSWATYADAAAATPADGTGGTATSTLARTTTASEVLRGVGAGKFAKPASNEQGEGFSYDFTLDVQDYDGSKPLYVTFDYMTTTNYASGDIRVFVYDKDGAALLNVTSLTGDGSVAAAPDPSRFTGVFYSTSGNNDYRLIFHVTSTNASAYDFVIDNVSVSPQATVPGAIVTQRTAYTPTITHDSGGITNYTISADYWRVGSRVYVTGAIVFSGASANFGSIYISLPTGYPIYSAAMKANAGGAGSHHLGTDNWLDTGTAAGESVVYYRSSGTSLTTVNVRYADDAATGVISTQYTQAAPITWGAGDSIAFKFDYPIDAAASAALSTTETMLTSARARYTTGAGQAIADNTITIIDYGTVDYDTHSAATTGASWKFTAPKSAMFLVNFGHAFGSTTSNQVYYAYKNGSLYQRIAQNVATENNQMSGAFEIYLTKGDYFDIRVWHATGASRSLDTTATNNWVVISSMPDFSIFSVYGIGEVVEAGAALGAYGITADQFGDLTSISLTPGEWDISVQGFFFSNGATTTTRIDLGVSSTSGNSSTGLVAGDTLMSGTKATASGTYQNISLLKRAVTVTSTTTYYLKARAATSITNLQVAYMISARRIK